MDLRCEGLVNPLGIDSAEPNLYWRMSSLHNGARQTAYQVLWIKKDKKGTEYFHLLDLFLPGMIHG